MSRVFHVARFKLALIAVIFASAAVYLQQTAILPLESRYTATMVKECALLPDVVTFGELKATVEASRFKGALACPVGVEPVAGTRNQFRLFANHTDTGVAESALAQAEQLLAIEVRGLATAEVEISLKHLSELGELERSRLEARRVLARPVSSRQGRALSVGEGRKALRLRREIKGLKAFLSSGTYPEWLRKRIDGRELASLNAEIESAEIELKSQSRVWKNSTITSKQKKLLKHLRAERREARLQLSSSLLRSHELELAELEKKVEANLDQRLNQAVGQQRVVQEKAPDPDAFLSERAEKLRKRAQRREAKAKLIPISGPTVTVEQASGYWVSFALWSASLLSLVAALFAGGRTGSSRRVPGLQPQLPRKEDSPTPAQSLTPQVRLQGLYSKLSQTLGKEPGTILVLGSEEGLARSSFSLRLAKTFGVGQRRVKLVDFDLPEKELTIRLSDRSTPGVGDILVSGGPVDEFFASLPGTNIEFAAAGSQRVLHEPICTTTLNEILREPRQGVTLIDASFSSPLHLLVGHIDAVLCLTQRGTAWNEQQEDVLLALRDAKLPIWGVARGGSEIFPFI